MTSPTETRNAALLLASHAANATDAAEMVCELLAETRAAAAQVSVAQADALLEAIDSADMAWELAREAQERAETELERAWRVWADSQGHRYEDGRDDTQDVADAMQAVRDSLTEHGTAGGVLADLEG